MFKDWQEEVSRGVLTSWEKKKIIALLDFWDVNVNDSKYSRMTSFREIWNGRNKD